MEETVISKALIIAACVSAIASMCALGYSEWHGGGLNSTADTVAWKCLFVACLLFMLGVFIELAGRL